MAFWWLQERTDVIWFDQIHLILEGKFGDDFLRTESREQHKWRSSGSIIFILWQMSCQELSVLISNISMLYNWLY